MKARLLKSLLQTTRIVANYPEYVAIGSGLVHNVISVDKKTFRLKSNFTVYDDPELQDIWNKLSDLIISGQMQEIIEGRDVIENPLPVFTVVYGELVESVTDKYGWPNTDDNGVLMFNNTHFPTKDQAIRYGIHELQCGIQLLTYRIHQEEVLLMGIKAQKQIYQERLENLKSLVPNK